MTLLDKTVITFTCDEKYVPYSHILVRSICKNSPGVDICARLVNCDEQHSIALKELFNNIIILNDNKKLSTKRDKMTLESELIYEESIISSLYKNKTSVKPARFLYSEQIAYCSNIKFDTIDKLLSEGYNNVIYMDVDTIIRKNLDTLFKTMSDGDICLFKDEPYSQQVTGKNRLKGVNVLYHGGLICVNNTKVTVEKIKQIKTYVSENIFDWDIDEKILAELVDDTDIKIINLPVTFKDEDLSEDSHIWSGSGNTKFTNDKYIEECRKYNPNL